MNAPVWIQARGIGDGNLMAQMAWNNIEDYREMAAVQLRRIAENNFHDARAERMETQAWADLKVPAEERAGVAHLRAMRATADAH